MKFLNRASTHIPLYLLHMINDGYSASILLLLPFIVKEMNLTLTQAGLLGTLVSVVGIFVSLPAAYLSRRLGGIKTLLLALLLSGLGYIGVSFAPTYLWLLPMFIFAGIGFGLFHPIGFALIARLSDKATRGKEMGNFTAIGDVGRIGIASVLTIVVVSLGWRSTALIYALVALAIVAILFFLFRSTEKPVIKNETKTPMRFREILLHRSFLFISIATFFDVFASATLFVFLPFLLLERGVDPAVLGSFISAFFIGNLFGKTTLGRLVDRFGSARIFIVAEVLMAIFIFLLANATTFAVIIICSIILGIFAKGTKPVIMTMVSEETEHHGNFEKSFGLIGVVDTTAATIAPLVLGIVADTFGIVVAFNTIAVIALLTTTPILLLRLTRTSRS